MASTASKQNLSGIICLAGTVVTTVCIWRMIPLGLSGETAKVKLYFGIMAAAFVVSILSGTAYYYFRNRRKSDTSFDVMRAEVEALAQAGQKNTTPKDLGPQAEERASSPVKRIKG